MKNPSIKIELDNVSDEISVWKRTVDVFCTDKPTIKSTSSNGFKILKDAGFSDKSFNTFDSNVENAATTIQNFYNSVSNYMNNMKEYDIEIEEKTPNALVINKDDTSPSAISFDYENQFTSSKMGDLAKERNELNKGVLSNGATYDGSYNGVGNKNLNNIVKDDTQQVDYKDNTVNEKKVTLTKLENNATGQAMYDSNSTIMKETLSNIKNDNVIEKSEYDSTYSIKEKQALNKLDTNNVETASFDASYSSIQ